ncbi:MAG TPA: aspartyl protease family protein [Opitutaceae bacterium]
MRPHPCLVSCALLFLGGCVIYRPFPRTTALSADLATLPSGCSSDGSLYVEMRLNGAGPFKILVDTGSPMLFVNADVAAAAKLKPRGRVIASGATDREEAVVSEAESVESGDLRLQDVSVIAVAHGKDPELARLGFDGICGLPLFHDVVLVLDYPGHQVRVRRLGSMDFPADRALPFTGVTPIVPLRVAGKSESALLDTGSGFTLIVGGFDSLPFVEPPLKDEGLGGFGLGSMTGARERNGQLAGEAQVGPIHFIDPPLRAQYPGRDANIGIGVLDHLALAFDQRSHRVYFLGRETTRTWAIERHPDAAHRAGFLGALEGGRIRLVEIDADGAFARAGLKPGDIILTVDDVPAGDFQTNQQWEAAPRRTLRIARGKDSMTILVSFQLQDEKG